MNKRIKLVASVLFVVILTTIMMVVFFTREKKFTVTFDTKGGSTVETINVKKGNKIQEPPQPIKTGYIFDGWWKESMGNNKWHFYLDQINSNLTLYAKWSLAEKAKVSYKVTLDTNNQTENVVHTIIENEKVEKPTDPKKEGYKFVGWLSNGKAYDFSLPVTGNIVLTAEWKKNEAEITPDNNATKAEQKTFKVILDTNNQTENVAHTIIENEKVEKPTDPKKEGYKFVGWLSNGKAYDFSLPVTENIVLTAEWKKNEAEITPDNNATKAEQKTFKVILDTNNQTENVAHTIIENEKVEKPTDPKKEGYKFVGWLSNGKAYDFSLPVTENIVLTAEWKKNDPIAATNSLQILDADIKRGLNYQYSRNYKYKHKSFNGNENNEYLATYQNRISNDDMMKDLGRHLGGLHKIDHSSIKKITYDSLDYTWNLQGTNEGSNWSKEQSTLMKEIRTKVNGENLNMKKFKFILSNGTDEKEFTYNIQIVNE